MWLLSGEENCRSQIIICSLVKRGWHPYVRRVADLHRLWISHFYSGVERWLLDGSWLIDAEAKTEMSQAWFIVDGKGSVQAFVVSDNDNKSLFHLLYGALRFSFYLLHVLLYSRYHSSQIAMVEKSLRTDVIRKLLTLSHIYSSVPR